MRGARIDEAAVLEAGLLFAALAIVGGGLALAAGGLATRISGGRGHREAPPKAGSIAGERHRHVSTVAAR